MKPTDEKKISKTILNGINKKGEWIKMKKN